MSNNKTAYKYFIEHKHDNSQERPHHMRKTMELLEGEKTSAHSAALTYAIAHCFLCYDNTAKIKDVEISVKLVEKLGEPGWINYYYSQALIGKGLHLLALISLEKIPSDTFSDNPIWMSHHVEEMKIYCLIKLNGVVSNTERVQDFLHLLEKENYYDEDGILVLGYEGIGLMLFKELNFNFEESVNEESNAAWKLLNYFSNLVPVEEAYPTFNWDDFNNK